MSYHSGLENEVPDWLLLFVTNCYARIVVCYHQAVNCYRVKASVSESTALELLRTSNIKS